MLLFWGTNQIRVKKTPTFFQTFVVSSPALTQLLILCLEHVELLGEAHDDHEEQQDHQSRGAHGQTHHLELSNHRLATGTLVPDVILDVTSEADKEVSEDRLREKWSQVELHIERKMGDKGRKQSRTKRYDREKLWVIKERRWTVKNVKWNVSRKGRKKEISELKSHLINFCEFCVPDSFTF